MGTLFFLILVAALVFALAATARLNRRHAALTDRRTCRSCGTSHPPFAAYCRRCGRQLLA